MNIYVAASFAYTDKNKTESRKADIVRIVSKIAQTGLSGGYYMPHLLKIDNAWDMSLEEWARKVFEHDLTELDRAKLVVFISYGKENNSGSVWECGYAYAKGIPVVVIKMTDETESLMVTNTARAIIKEEDINSYDFIKLPKRFITLDKLS